MRGGAQQPHGPESMSEEQPERLECDARRKRSRLNMDRPVRTGGMLLALKREAGAAAQEGNGRERVWKFSSMFRRYEQSRAEQDDDDDGPVSVGMGRPGPNP